MILSSDFENTIFVFAWHLKSCMYVRTELSTESKMTQAFQAWAIFECCYFCWKRMKIRFFLQSLNVGKNTWFESGELA
jgi:hypothetical protein